MHILGASAWTSVYIINSHTQRGINVLLASKLPEKSINGGLLGEGTATGGTAAKLFLVKTVESREFNLMKTMMMYILHVNI